MTIERKAWYIAVKELVPFLPVINTQAAKKKFLDISFLHFMCQKQHEAENF